MIDGLMQKTPLNISWIMRYAATAHGEREIVSRNFEEDIWRYDYAAMARRAASCANWLSSLGLQQGDRVSSLSWNTHRHLELFFAVPAMGCVLHTANPRLPEEHIIYTIQHAGSRILLYDSSNAAIVERLKPHLPEIAHFIMLCPEDYDAEIAAFPYSHDWPVIDENRAAFLCYTSGTTGDPKGVAYTHRSVVLHGLAAGLNGALAVSSFDVIMPCQSFYHATAWGLPFLAAINGAKMVLPCDKFDGASLQELIKSEGVTFSGGVPTIWTMYLDQLARTGDDTGTLDRIVIGGSAVPRAMAETLQHRYGVKVRQIWGMTETSPLGVLSTPTPKIASLGDDEMNEIIWTRQGRLQFGVEMKVVDDDGNELPHDGSSAGAVMVRGPWVIERYYQQESTALDAKGWFDTGDIATIDANGFMRITDRKKDVIKSGGEWISSIDIENIAVACPGVKFAAVVGVFHPKWEERPVLVVESHADSDLTIEDVLDWIRPKLVKWWLPDRILLDEVPLTSTGKLDKKVIRQKYADILRDI
jgi:acyl-CoA synthetase (AMP-forming)/AMP-acid ligase II